MATTLKISDRLGDICEFQTGYNVRGKLELGESGVPVIQLKDIGLIGIDPSDLGHAELGDVSPRYLVEDGDLVFRTRFEPNIAARLTGMTGSAVVLAPAVILRPNNKAVDTDYLIWYLKQAPSQRFLDVVRQGTNLPQIPIEELKRLPVQLPPIEVQRKLAAISALSEREYELQLEIANKRREIASFALLKQVRKTQPHKSGLGLKRSKGAATPEDI